MTSRQLVRPEEGSLVRRKRSERDSGSSSMEDLEFPQRPLEVFPRLRVFANTAILFTPPIPRNGGLPSEEDFGALCRTGSMNAKISQELFPSIPERASLPERNEIVGSEARGLGECPQVVHDEDQINEEEAEDEENDDDEETRRSWIKRLFHRIGQNARAKEVLPAADPVFVKPMSDVDLQACLPGDPPRPPSEMGLKSLREYRKRLFGLALSQLRELDRMKTAVEQVKWLRDIVKKDYQERFW